MKLTRQICVDRHANHNDTAEVNNQLSTVQFIERTFKLTKAVIGIALFISKWMLFEFQSNICISERTKNPDTYLASKQSSSHLQCHLDNQKQQFAKPGIILHCKDGTGPSGTVLCCLLMRDSIENDKTFSVNVLNNVLMARKHRQPLVHNFVSHTTAFCDRS